MQDDHYAKKVLKQDHDVGYSGPAMVLQLSGPARLSWPSQTILQWSGQVWSSQTILQQARLSCSGLVQPDYPAQSGLARPLQSGLASTAGQSDHCRIVRAGPDHCRPDYSGQAGPPCSGLAGPDERLQLGPQSVLSALNRQGERHQLYVSTRWH